MKVKRANIDLNFEIKSMGVSFYVPIILTLFITIYLFSISQPEISLVIALKLIEFLFVPFSSWWVIYLFYDYFEEDGGEILFSYPVSVINLGIARVMIFVLFYNILLLMVVAAIALNSQQEVFINLILQLAPQVIFFSGLAFSLMTFFKDIGISISFIAVYVVTELLSAGQVMPWYHVFFFNEIILDLGTMIPKSLLNTIIGILLFWFGHYFLTFKQK